MPSCLTTGIMLSIS